MLCEGYKYSEYDATYKQAVFNVVDRGNDVLEITDTESGNTFIVALEKPNKDRTRSWREQEQEGNRKGRSIHFGSKGFFKQLEYNSNRKGQKK